MNSQQLEDEEGLDLVTSILESANLAIASLADLSLSQINTMIEEQENISLPTLTKSRSNISAHSCSFSFSMDKQMAFYEQMEKSTSLIKSNKSKLQEISTRWHLWKKDETYEKFYKKLKITLEACLKIMVLRQGQLKGIGQLFENPQITKSGYETKYRNPLGQFGVPYPIQNKGVPNIQMALKAMKTQFEHLQKQDMILDQIIDNIRNKKYVENLMSLIIQEEKLKIVNSKLTTLTEQFPYSCCVPFDDLLSLPPDHERIQFVDKFVERVRYGERQKIRQSFTKIKENMNVINSIMGILDDPNAENKWASTQILKCLLFKKDAHHETERMMAEPSVETPKNIWNLTHQKKMKPFVKVANLPSITFSEKLYLPRIFTKIFTSKGKQSLPEETFIDNIEEYYTKLKTKKDQNQALLIRINCPFKINTRLQPHSGKPQCDKLVIHFHGSGFIGFSTFVHQAYVRTWAKNLGVPIISVEYRKAPQNPYPAAIQDCLQAFLWAAFCFRQVYEIDPKKIVLVGDSSGGNLVAVLNNILLQWGLFRPSGAVLVYPALNLNYRSFTPSLLSALNDMILPHTFLKICLKCYLQDPDLKPESDALISPLLVEDSTIKQYPPFEIFIGDVDAFHDDALRLTERINKIVPGRCRTTIFEQFPHGFIMFDMKIQGHQSCADATKRVQRAIGRMLNQEKGSKDYMYEDQDHRGRKQADLSQKTLFQVSSTQ